MNTPPRKSFATKKQSVIVLEIMITLISYAQYRVLNFFILAELPAEEHIKVLKKQMGEMTVFDLPGIGKTYGAKLVEKKICLAKDVLEMFLRLNRDEKKFLDWIREACGANRKYGGDCYRWLKEWYDAHSSQP